MPREALQNTESWLARSTTKVSKDMCEDCQGQQTNLILYIIWYKSVRQLNQYLLVVAVTEQQAGVVLAVTGSGSIGECRRLRQPSRLLGTLHCVSKKVPTFILSVT